MKQNIIKNFENTQIKVAKCSGKIGNGKISGTFNVSNLNSYYLTANISSIIFFS